MSKRVLARMGVSPRQFPGNLKKQEGKMDQDRRYNKISTNEQQIKYEFTNQDVVAFRIGGWGGGFLIICLSRASLPNTPGA